ncbi:MAG TPA: choice-of-anchor tandem repeat GloVer-containing protein [Candidatus Acidoferrales bacterium]|nr:choice-of-anchor tandem repeat GloVer-containing protein [Candidatus Acidoferrales bacterium]
MSLALLLALSAAMSEDTLADITEELTFDGLTGSFYPSSGPLPMNYAGLTWNGNWSVVSFDAEGPAWVYNGTSPASISSPTPITVLSAGFYGVKPPNLQLEIMGRREGATIYDETFILPDSYVATNFTLNFTDVDEIDFNACPFGMTGLTIVTPPIINIDDQPANLLTVQGSNAVFTVESSGTEPMSYQWQHNGTNLVDDDEGHVFGSTSDMLEIDDVDTNDAGNYSVLVSSGGDTTNSENATLTVAGLGDMIPDSEYNALVALYNATAGTSWTDNSGWLDPGSTEWYGVDVTNLEFVDTGILDYEDNPVYALVPNSGNVSEVSLETNHLAGNIINGLSNLTWLQTLDLSGNELQGNIPGFFAFLDHLQILDLSSNQLSGSIPGGFGNLSLNLVTLDLSGNNLGGAIPSDLYAMSRLETLDLSQNHLSGAINLGIMESLTTLDLHDNALNGSLLYVGIFPQLQFMDLSGNSLLGTIPVDTGFFLGLSESTLQHLDLGDNQLSGTIPNFVGFTQLQYLDLSGNQISGSIPVALEALTQLQTLDLSGNNLSNGIPALGSLTGLRELDLSTNKLTGSLPAGTLLELGNLQMLNLAGNHFSGSVIDLYPLAGTLQTYNIQKNDFDFLANFGPPAPSNISAVNDMSSRGIQVTYLPQNPPSITANPKAESVPNGGPDPFSVSVMGAPPFGYHWQLGGTNLVDNGRISGSLTSNLVINPVQYSDQGDYQVVVTNVYGSVTSAPAMLTVTTNGLPPKITSQPVMQSVSAGGSTSFTVQALGSTPVSYQWLLNGTALAGATSENLDITSATLANAGSYSVIVSNAFGIATNVIGTLTVTTIPVELAPNGIQYNGGLAEFQINGLAANENLEIETSTNLLQWTPFDFITGVSGTIQIIDSGAGDFPMKFYRILGSVIQFAASPTSGSGALNVQFSSPDVDSGGNTITNWNWSFGDGTSGTGQNPTHTYTSVGIFYPTLLAVNQLGNIVNGFGPDISVSDFTVQFAANPTTGATPLSVQFTSPSVDSGGNTIVAWNWNFGDGSTSTMQNPLHVYNSVGVYQPGLIATNSAGLVVQGYGVPTIYAGLISLNDLYDFTAFIPYTTINYDGAQSVAGLVISGSTLFGTTQLGGNSGNGTVFAVSLDGTGYTNLYSFSADDNNGTNSDGASPMAGLTLSNNTLYGTTTSGGLNGSGTLFAINTDGTSFTNIYNFGSSGDDGVDPMSALIISGNKLYGTTISGGANGWGAVYAINTDGTCYTNLYSFSDGDGAAPECALTLAEGTLYGTTSAGGVNSYGTVFSLSTNGSGFTTIYNFTRSDEGNPSAGVILSGSNLYGTTPGGAFGWGTVYTVNTNGGGFRNLYVFTGSSDEGGINAGLIQSGNVLYGTASGGFYLDGTIFSINTDGTEFVTLYSFGGPDGANPMSSLLLYDNTLFGTTQYGGTNNNGTVFGFPISSINQGL